MHKIKIETFGHGYLNGFYARIKHYAKRNELCSLLLNISHFQFQKFYLMLLFKKKNHVFNFWNHLQYICMYFRKYIHVLYEVEKHIKSNHHF